MFYTITKVDNLDGTGNQNISFNGFSSYNQSFSYEDAGVAERTEAAALRAATAYGDALKIGLNSSEYNID